MINDILTKKRIKELLKEKGIFIKNIESINTANETTFKDSIFLDIIIDIDSFISIKFKVEYFFDIEKRDYNYKLYN